MKPARFAAARAVAARLEAYRRARYAVDAVPGRLPALALRAGLPAPTLERAFEAELGEGFAVVTAWNPGGEVRPPEENAAREAALGEELRRAGLVLLSGRGEDDAGQWAAEESAVVLGIGREEAVRLGGAHGQLAIAYAARGGPLELVPALLPPLERPRVLVTGSAGLLGRTLAAQLSPWADVVGWDVAPGPHATALAALVEGADAVIHAGGLHPSDLARRTRAELEAILVGGTAAVLDACARAGVDRVVYAGTTSVYGHALEPAGAAVWVDESLPPRPRDACGESQLAAEALCRSYAGGGRTAIVLRAGRCEGEGEARAAVRRLHRGADARDVAAAHALALLAPVEGHACAVVSARSPFRREDCAALLRAAPAVLAARAPAVAAGYAQRGWAVPTSLDRVYDPGAAERLLGFRAVLDAAALVEAR